MPTKVKDSYQVAQSGLKALEYMQDVAIRIEAEIAYLELFDNMPSQKHKGDSWDRSRDRRRD